MHYPLRRPLISGALLIVCTLSQTVAGAQSLAPSVGLYTSSPAPQSAADHSADYTAASGSPDSAALTSTQDIVVYNFNDASTNTADAGAANTSLLLSADRGTGTLTTNFNPDDILSTAGTVVNAGTNAGNADPAGAALVLRPGFAAPDNNGKALTLMGSTLGFTNIILSFGAERTSTGFSSNQVQYSTDGTTYTNFGAAFDVPVISHGGNPYTALQYDLSGISGLNNDPQAAFRIVFNGGTDGSGNIRLDNLRLSGAAVAIAAAPEPSASLTFVIGLALLLRCRLCVRARSQNITIRG